MEKIREDQRLKNQIFFSPKLEDKSFALTLRKKSDNIRKNTIYEETMKKRKLYTINNINNQEFQELKQSINFDFQKITMSERLFNIINLINSENLKDLKTGICILEDFSSEYNSDNLNFSWENYTQEKSILIYLINALLQKISSIDNDVLLNSIYTTLINVTSILDTNDIENIFFNDFTLNMLQKHIDFSNQEMLISILMFLFNIFAESKKFSTDFVNHKIFTDLIKKFKKISLIPKYGSFEKLDNEKKYLAKLELYLNFMSLMEFAFGLDRLIEIKKVEKILKIVCYVIFFDNKDLQISCISILESFSKNYMKANIINAFSTNFDSIIQLFMESKLFDLLISIDLLPHFKGTISLLTFFENLAFYYSHLVYNFLEINFFDYLNILFIQTNNTELYIKTIRIIKNFSQSQDRYKHEIIESSITKSIFKHVLNNQCNLAIIREFAYLIKMLTDKCKFGIANDLLKIKFFEVIMTIFSRSYGSNIEIVLVLLNSLYNVIQAGNVLIQISKKNNFLRLFDSIGGFHSIDSYTTSPNDDIYQIATKIVELKQEDY